MELKLQLGIFMLFIQVSLAVWQRKTVMKGQTLELHCPITDAHKTNVEWRNPDGHLMFFNHDKVLRDKRYSIIKLSESEFNIAISDVTFKDGGNYTCTQYDTHTTEKKVEVTVLRLPIMTETEDAGKCVVKCTAEGNHYLPQISWKLDNGPEFLTHGSQILLEDRKYVSSDTLYFLSVDTRVTVKCLVRHPSRDSQPLMNFVKIGRDSTKSTTMISPPTSQPQGSTEVLKTTTRWFRHGKTTGYFTTRDVPGPSPESFSGSHLSTSEAPRTSVLSDSTRTRNESISNATSTTDWTSVSETTNETTFYNHTEGNRTVSSNDQEMRIAKRGSSSLLVFLVTCLIFALLVVVLFFAIKLRRAHITWKKVFIVTENEDSDPSEESSKSKSSQEEKNAQGQRRRGLFNTAFTQYVVEEPTGITSVINTGATTATQSTNKEQTSQPQTQAQTSAKHDIKETEL
ncbi:cytotoxic and regulatory T-cell molecule isoform X2 [Thunnus albacares]|uniref:cytotoxic and regulatory T-cell molecule isoform X2 n=1 Tax=Thunnus albacares TaxID=8236 RepID=UPI001CF6540E|nr:cytotoxic and regulatory T-cell molecule isoform X2 [Thunnus albacares]